MSSAVKILKHFELPKEAGAHHRLVCLTGKNKGLAYFLTGKRVVLGRTEKADIRVHDIKSSREHAEIIRVGKDYVITDLGSQNGVIVNDLKIKQHILNPNDKIIIGKTVYKFNQVEVKAEVKKVEETTEEFEDEEFEEEPKSKMTLILGVVALLSILLLFTGEDEQVLPGKGRAQANYKVNELSDPFISS
ncbi:MAG: FHA domain-containing protein [Bacteriovoracaceae bacterium]